MKGEIDGMRFAPVSLPCLHRNQVRKRQAAIGPVHQTRLLDWTESLLIAAFFAVEGAAEREPGIIYGVRGLPLADAADDPFSLEKTSVYRPSHITPRVAPQWSVFTVHPDPTEDFRRSGHVRTWTIRGTKNGWRIKCILDSCGINYASIYPDLSGLARHIYWRYKWGMSQTRPHAWRESRPKRAGAREPRSTRRR